MIETIEFNGKEYPAFQSNGNAARFILPFAKEVCKGDGLDIGANRKEWAYPGARMIDADDKSDPYHANYLPDGPFDYIFSSHCLEHVPDWVGTLDYWIQHIKPMGTLFLYLPDYSQEYWRPWNNRKHVNALAPWMIRDFLKDRGMRKIFTSRPDLYNSFAAIAEIP